jgi:DNA repair ATPase RecN
MDYSAFEGIGFTNIEAKVFTILLELSESKAGKIIERSSERSFQLEKLEARMEALNALMKGYSERFSDCIRHNKIIKIMKN